jgi:hypothetical protein
MPDRRHRKPERPASLADAHLERAGREGERLRREWGDFLATFAWCHFVTLTLRQPCSPERLRRRFLDQWIRRLASMTQTSPPYFFAIEETCAGWPHVHALVAATAALTTARLESAWDYGFTDVREYDASRGGAHYVVKGIGRTCELYDVSRRLPSPLRAVA